MNTLLSWRIAFLGASIAFLLSGCGGCDEVGESEFDAGETDVAMDDVFGDDVSAEDVDIDEDAGVEPCDEEGDTRPCGTDVGECEMGEQLCLFGRWQPCEGGVEPRPEQCNGLDDSCSGVADDGAQDEMCASPTACLDSGQCVDGQCEYEEAVDCSFMDGPCTFGECSTKSGQCVLRTIEDGTSCDDGDFCTVAGTCQEGVCQAEERDCSDAGDQCNEGVCDAALEECVPSPVSDGTTCDDELFCTVNTSCSDGQCVGSERSCSAFSDQCNEGVCNEDVAACEASPVADGTGCDNGLYCTINDTCQEGTCSAGDDRTCTAEDGACREGECDEANNTCTGDPLPDDTPCDDGLYCTINTTCQAGDCADPQPRDCSGAGDQCNAGFCDEDNSTCSSQPVADGTSCDDGLFCTINNACDDGSCVGVSRDCSGLADQCNQGSCSESAESCVAQPTNIGGSCDDGLYCTVNDVCLSDGTCQGSQRDCSSLDSTCQFGTCDESAESCVAEDELDGTSCEDGDFCTVNEECIGGTCVVEENDCAAYADECHTASCDVPSQSCKTTNFCDPCEEGNPVADPGEDQEVIPNSQVNLDGSGSTDSDGQDLEYFWYLQSQPGGSNATLQGENTVSPSFTADVAGEFVVCLEVTNEDDCDSELTDEACLTVTVVPDVDLHIELTWEASEDDNPIDLDLQYRAPGAGWFQTGGGPGGPNNPCNAGTDATPYGVWWCEENPDWGTIAAHNPVLDIDSIYGGEPENINQEELFDGQGFRVGVHHWYDYENGPFPGRVRIYVGGILEFEETHTTACGEIWEVADIDISDNGQTVEITSLNQQIVPGTMGPCQ